MTNQKLPEYWLRGPVQGVPPLLQPVAHALLQAGDEVAELMENFAENLLWETPGGVASVGFHLQHLTGVLDRLFTYALNQPLSQQQLKYLSEEGIDVAGNIKVADLVQAFQQQIQKAIAQLKNTDEKTLTDQRLVGRKNLPSTVIGLLFHAAEHTMRHTGQLLVTARILKAAS